MADALEKLGDLRERMGQYPDARNAYGRARRLRVDDAIGLARLCMKQATVADRVGSYPQALGWLRRGINLVSGNDDPPATKLHAHLIAEYGSVRQAQGRRQDAVRWLNEAIEAAQRATSGRRLPMALFVLDWALVDLGRSDEAVHSQRALELYDELGRLGPQATIYNNLGTFAYYEARWDDAVELFEKARQLRLRLGRRGRRGHWERSTSPRCGATRAASTRRGRGSRRQAAYGVRLTTASAWPSSTSGLGTRRQPLRRVRARAASCSIAARDEVLPALVSEHDLIDTDARIAESLVLQGRSRDALELATRCLERTAAHGGDTHDPMLHRIRGYCVGAARRREGGAERSSTAASRSRASQERALRDGLGAGCDRADR